MDLRQAARPERPAFDLITHDVLDALGRNRHAKASSDQADDRVPVRRLLYDAGSKASRFAQLHHLLPRILTGRAWIEDKGLLFKFLQGNESITGQRMVF